MLTKSDHTRLKNWRPITLLTTNYKILTKAPATCHTQVLLSIINSDQTACIPGWTINDNLSLISDVTSFTNKRQTPLTLISIYQLKAFKGFHNPSSFLPYNILVSAPTSSTESSLFTIQFLGLFKLTIG